jgi:uncharacterized tellurite resistance protein B-like protein
LQPQSPTQEKDTVDNTTRRLLKILQLTPDQVYHVFCLALCLTCSDGNVSDKEAEVLTRIGFGLGLSPQDIQALVKNAQAAIVETSIDDVIALSVASLKASLDPEKLASVRQILEFVATADRQVGEEERKILEIIEQAWAEGSVSSPQEGQSSPPSA